MISMRRSAFTVAAMILTLAVAALGQAAATPAPDQAKASTPAAAPPAESHYVESPGFKTKIFEVKYGDPDRFRSLLEGLTSGFRGAVVRVQPEFHTITARDFPENLAAMEEALKRLDKPQPPRPSIELHIHILIATDSANAGSPDYPAEMTAAIKQLQGTLKYKSYILVASGVQRAKEGPYAVDNSGAIGIAVEDNSGVAVWGNPQARVRTTAHYSYSMRPISIDSSTSGQPSIQSQEFRFSMNWPGSQVGFSSPLTLKDGEQVVVGTTTVGNGAVVVVISGRIIN